MIEIDLLEMAGLTSAIKGMRNPMNSWDKSDTLICGIQGPYRFDVNIGDADIALMKKLALAGEEHAKYRRMITLWVDIKAPLYWWKEFDTYKVGTVANSCSTMHTIANKEFTLNDFSHEQLIYDFNYSMDEGDNTVTLDYLDEYCLLDSGEYESWESPYNAGEIAPLNVLELTIAMLNKARDRYNTSGDKKYWWQMIQLLPSSYNQLRTVMLNYEVLSKIYKQRKNHKLNEWANFCKWIEELPLAAEVIFPDKEKNDEQDLP